MSSVRGSGLSGDDGGVVVLTALMLPFIVLLLSLSIDIGNWWIHKRHLQMQVDAAALAGGAMFGKCFTDPSAGNAAIQDEATKYNGAAGSLYNGQVGNSNKGTITVRYQSKTFATGGPGPDDTETQLPCETPSLMFDVKGTEANLPLLFKFPGLHFVPAINAQARVQLKTVIVQDGMLPVAVPDLRFNYAFATFVNEATGAVLATSELGKTGTSGGQQLWSSLAGVDVPISTSHIGVRIRLVGGTDPNASCGQLYTECYDLTSGSGVVHIRGWSASTAPAVQNAWLLAGTCAPDAYFAMGDCSAGLQAEVDLGSNHPVSGSGVTTEVWATVDGAGKYLLTPSGSSGLVTWSTNTGMPLSGGGPHNVALDWSYEQTTGTWSGKTCTNKNNNPCKDSGSLGVVQRGFVASPDYSGPVERVQVSGPSVTSGANSFEQGTTQTLGVSIAVKGSLGVQSQATDPVVELRVTGSQNQSIDCDPNLSNLRDEIENGCGPAYKINTGLACPAYNALWGLPEPWECVKTQTGGAVGQVEHGMKDRILGGANSCTAPINWPNFEPGDPRIVPLLITPFGSFSGSGNDIVPVIDFGVFYVVGWNGDPCPGAHSVPKGYIAGHFIKYAAPNPHGAGDEICDPTSLTPCVAVMTR
ncbi:MAG TPA: pilus assembly protein TadG-related protein [Gaiellaceae bacterium]|nr:pilus assembly protein TadG-related protein [Gaiellaceae bacterium]